MESPIEVSFWTRIKNVYENGKIEFFTNLLLVLLGISGITFTLVEILNITHVFQAEQLWIEKLLQALIGGMIAFLAFHFVLEKFNATWKIEKHVEKANETLGHIDKIVTETDKKFSLQNECKFDTLDGAVQETLKKSIKSFVELQRLKSASDAVNPEFGEVVDKFLEEQRRLLNLLSTGHLEVPNKQAAHMYGLLAKEYRKRFDAVSDKDIPFWLSEKPEDVAYYEICRGQAKDEKTVVTRIFVLEASELYKQPQSLVEVLKRQFEAGISWGVAIEDEFDAELWHLVEETRPDFALFDIDKAISFFRKDGGRKFKIAFNVGKKNSVEEIRSNRIMYKKILAHCWMVNAPFIDDFPGAFNKESTLNEVKSILATRNTKVKSLGVLNPENEHFLLVASSPDEVPAKVLRLAEILRTYQEKTGKGASRIHITSS